MLGLSFSVEGSQLGGEESSFLSKSVIFSNSKRRDERYNVRFRLLVQSCFRHQSRSSSSALLSYLFMSVAATISDRSGPTRLSFIVDIVACEVMVMVSSFSERLCQNAFLKVAV